MIFAAGLGTRLKPLTDTMPKALVPMLGKPLLQWQVEKLLSAGITDIVVNVHHFADMIIDAVRNNNGWGANITISDERDNLLDTGGGVRKVVRSQCTMHHEPLLLCNVDILSNLNLQDVVNAAQNDTNDGLLVVSDRQTQRYLCFDKQDQLCGWTNTATGEFKGQDGRRLAYSGTAVLKPALWPLLDEVAQEKGDKFSIIDLYLKVVSSREKAVGNKATLKAYVPRGEYKMMDVGKIDKIAEAEQFAARLANEA